MSVSDLQWLVSGNSIRNISTRKNQSVLSIEMKNITILMSSNPKTDPQPQKADFRWNNELWQLANGSERMKEVIRIT